MNFAIALNHNWIHCTYFSTIKRHYFRCAIDNARAQCVVYIFMFGVCTYVWAHVRHALECFGSRNHYQIFIKMFVRFDMDWFVFGVRLFHFMGPLLFSIIPIFHHFRLVYSLFFSCILWPLCVYTDWSRLQSRSFNKYSNHYLFHQYFTVFFIHSRRRFIAVHIVRLHVSRKYKRVWRFLCLTEIVWRLEI